MIKRGGLLCSSYKMTTERLAEFVRRAMRLRGNHARGYLCTHSWHVIKWFERKIVLLQKRF